MHIETGIWSKVNALAVLKANEKDVDARLYLFSNIYYYDQLINTQVTAHRLSVSMVFGQRRQRSAPDRDSSFIHLRTFDHFQVIVAIYSTYSIPLYN